MYSATRCSVAQLMVPSTVLLPWGGRGDIDKRVQYMIEGVFALRRSGFSGHSAVRLSYPLEAHDRVAHEWALGNVLGMGKCMFHLGRCCPSSTSLRRMTRSRMSFRSTMSNALQNTSLSTPR